MRDDVWHRRVEASKLYGESLRRLRWLRLRMTIQALSDAIDGQVSLSRISEVENNRTPKVLFGPERHAALSTYFAHRLGADDPDVAAYNAAYDVMFFAFEGDGASGSSFPDVANSARASGDAARSAARPAPAPQDPSSPVSTRPAIDRIPAGSRLLTTAATGGDHGPRARLGRPLLLGALSFVLVATLLIGGGLWLFPRLVHQTSSTTAPIALAGELLAVVQVGPRGGGLGLVDPATARVTSLFLAPDAQSGVQRYLAPAFTSIGDRVGYIGVAAATGVRSLWIVPVLMAPGSTSIVEVAPPGPTRVLADCGPCNTLSWSADGQWLFYDGPNGLLAFNPITGAQRSVTHGAHDAWPACSPDGQWLAYQHAVETLGQLVVVPAQNCFPLQGAPSQPLVVSGYLIAWHPTWSGQEDQLAFIGVSSTGQGVYEVDTASFSGRSATPSSHVTPRLVSGMGCAEPVWVSQPHRMADVLLYICRTQSVQRFLAVRSTPPASPPMAVSRASSGQPTLFNPVWLPASS